MICDLYKKILIEYRELLYSIHKQKINDLPKYKKYM